MRVRVAAAFGTVLLLAACRVFFPSLTTLFGRAGETDPLFMGAFALAVFLVPAAALPLVGRAPRAAVLGSAGAAAAAALALAAAGGGAAQLYGSAAAVALAAAWLVALCATAESRAVVSGVTAGIAVTAVQQTLLQTVDPIWRGGIAAVGAAAVYAAVFLAASWAARAEAGHSGARSAGGARAGSGWFALGPLLFLPALFTANTAVTGVAEPHPAAAAAVCGAAVLAVLLAERPQWTGHPAVPSAAVLAAAAAFVLAPSDAAGMRDVLPGWAVAAQVAGHFAVAACAGWAVQGSGRAAGPLRSGAGALGGVLLFPVLMFAFYAAYDLHFSNAPVPFAAAGLLAVCALAGVPRVRSLKRDPALPARVVGGVAATALAAGAAAVAVLPAPAAPPPAAAPEQAGAAGLRVAAYNVRMGFALDGRYAAGAQADAVRSLDPHVVFLSEVDRGWALNGGHDGLRTMERQLGMAAVWAPADGPLWGDALLTSLPVTRTESHALPSAGPTGAQALAAELDWDGTAVTAIATHLQPADGFAADSAADTAQLLALTRIVEDAQKEGPVILGGDLNLEPGGPAWSALTGTGLADAFAGDRPVNTLATGGGDPLQIDHLLATPGLRPADTAAPDLPLSDHRPIAATFVRQGG